MKALIQRVSFGKVLISGNVVSEIGKGYVILLGVKDGDSREEAEILAEKTVNLRIRSDSKGKMNLSILDTNGEVLVVSQFTLYADCRKGRRPSFIKSAKPDLAKALYLHYVEMLKKLGVRKVTTGKFGAYMDVELVNDGPVTIMLDTEEL